MPTVEQTNSKIRISDLSDDEMKRLRIVTTEQMNREVAEWLGICWHEWHVDRYWKDRGAKVFYCKCGASYENEVPKPINPDFSQGAGIIRLLEKILRTEDGMQLVMTLIGQFVAPGYISELACQGYCVIFLENYITTPSKLLQAVWEWSKWHPKCFQLNEIT
jgi:hypothetical protein